MLHSTPTMLCSPTLSHCRVYHRLGKAVGIPVLECFLVEGGFRFIVLELLGKDLKCIFKEWYP